jgi:hypothetical protein
MELNALNQNFHLLGAPVELCNSLIIRTAISEDDVFLRACLGEAIPKNVKNPELLQKVTKETKSRSLCPGPSFPSLPSVKSE